MMILYKHKQIILNMVTKQASGSLFLVSRPRFDSSRQTQKDGIGKKARSLKHMVLYRYTIFQWKHNILLPRHSFPIKTHNSLAQYLLLRTLNWWLLLGLFSDSCILRHHHLFGHTHNIGHHHWRLAMTFIYWCLTREQTLMGLSTVGLLLVKVHVLYNVWFWIV